ncbi:hypothetical protein BH10PSE19_BH10PSE19_10660 [soil metagenome]
MVICQAVSGCFMFTLKMIGDMNMKIVRRTGITASLDASLALLKTPSSVPPLQAPPPTPMSPTLLASMYS